MPLVAFTAPCDRCGADAWWQQTGGADPVRPADFIIRCHTCDPPIPAELPAVAA